MEFFTADTHFFHQKLLYAYHFCKRDFFLIEEMHRAIIKQWNQVVTNQDIVYHLGDIAVIAAKRSEYQWVLELLKQLNGQIVFLKGNHDTRAFFKFLSQNNYQLTNQQPKFKFHDVGVLLKRNGHQLFLTHYPLMLGKTHNSVNLHGHIHHTMINNPNNINVGLDSVEAQYLKTYKFGRPFSLTEVEMMIQAKKRDFQKML